MQKDNGGPALKIEEKLTSLIYVLRPREECTLPALIEFLGDCKIGDAK